MTNGNEVPAPDHVSEPYPLGYTERAGELVENEKHNEVAEIFEAILSGQLGRREAASKLGSSVRMLNQSIKSKVWADELSK